MVLKASPSTFAGECIFYCCQFHSFEKKLLKSCEESNKIFPCKNYDLSRPSLSRLRTMRITVDRLIEVNFV
jgi:hypothetical protein